MPGPYVSTKSSLVVVKAFTYRGGTRLWSNRYHTNGPLTLTLAEFEILADAVVADELPMYSGGTSVVRVDWADATTASVTNPNGLVTHSKSYSAAGTFAATGGQEQPGNAAAVLRFSTDARTAVTNHPIYLFKYFHNVFRDGSAAVDHILPSQITQYNEYGDDWLAGFSDGTNTHILCSPRGAVAQARTTLDWIRHRDFPT